MQKLSTPNSAFRMFPNAPTADRAGFVGLEMEAGGRERLRESKERAKRENEREREPWTELD